MTTSEYVLGFGLLALILSTNLGVRALTRRRFTLPLFAVAIAAASFLRTVPTIGHDLLFITGAAVVGLGCGVLTGALSRLERRPDGRLVTRAGAAFAAVWVVIVGGRTLFGYGATHWWRDTVRTFSVHYQITPTAYTSAFVLMALAMVVGRLAVIGLQAARLLHGPAAAPAAMA